MNIVTSEGRDIERGAVPYKQLEYTSHSNRISVRMYPINTYIRRTNVENADDNELLATVKNTKFLEGPIKWLKCIGYIEDIPELHKALSFFQIPIE